MESLVCVLGYAIVSPKATIPKMITKEKVPALRLGEVGDPLAHKGISFLAPDSCFPRALVLIK